MKRYLNKFGILIILIMIFTVGCKKNSGQDLTTPSNNPIDNLEDVAKIEENPEKIMKEFQKILNSKDLDKVIDFVNNNISKVTFIEGDRMILELEELLESSRKLFTNEILLLKEDQHKELMEIKGDDLFFPGSKIEDISNNELREKISKLYNSNYKLINIEGMFEPTIDYEALKKYNNYISDELKDYIEIMANNSNEPMVVDGTLRISFQELGKRILKAEEYVKKYHGGQRYEEVLSLYRTWLGLYLGGLPNTPIEDPSSKVLKSSVVQSYMKISKEKDSATAFVVSKYLDIIKENNGIIDDNIKEKTLSFVNEALSLLETSK